MVWCLLHMICRGILPVNNNDTEQVIPLWRGYNSHVTELSEYVTESSGLTPINHTPSDKSTLYTSRKQNKQLTNALGQEISVQTFDLQLYGPSKEIIWSISEEFNNHFVRLGGFYG